MDDGRKLFRPLILLPSSLVFLALCVVASAEPLFITIDQVELKNSSGEWVSVIRPDRRLDIMEEEPVVRFFNNGRIPTGEYTNVRVHFTAEEEGRKAMILERVEDYAPPLAIKKGTFVGVTFSFDWKAGELISQQSVKEVKLITDQDERIDGGNKIKLWS